jgi:hypothetical protein
MCRARSWCSAASEAHRPGHLTAPTPGCAVVVTIGPACQDVDTLCQILDAGATCARCDLTVSAPLPFACCGYLFNPNSKEQQCACLLGPCEPSGQHIAGSPDKGKNLLLLHYKKRRARSLPHSCWQHARQRVACARARAGGLPWGGADARAHATRAATGHLWPLWHVAPGGECGGTARALQWAACISTRRVEAHWGSFFQFELIF